MRVVFYSNCYWRSSEKSTEVKVSFLVHENIEKGDDVHVYAFEGLLGIPFYEVYLADQ